MRERNETVKIDVTQNLKELDGTDLQFRVMVCPECGQATEGMDFTLRLAITSALVAQFPDEERKGIEPSEKVKRYALAMRVYNEDTPDLNLDERKLIWDLVAKMRGPLVVGQVWDLLDPEMDDKKVK